MLPSYAAYQNISTYLLYSICYLNNWKGLSTVRDWFSEVKFRQRSSLNITLVTGFAYIYVDYNNMSRLFVVFAHNVCAHQWFKK